MALFHVNPNTGEAGKCEAHNGKCPFGKVEEHFTSAEAARENYEEKMAEKSLPTVTKSTTSKTDGRSTRNDWADLEIYRSKIGKYDEVFVHPQGKIAIIHDARGMEVFKDGKRAKTSGTPNDLRAGRGAWKMVKGSNDVLPTAEDYRQSYVNPKNGGAPTTPTPAAVGVPVTPASAANPVMARINSNKALGYPANSQLDSSLSGTIKQSLGDGGGYMSPLSILPVKERANPHKDFKTSTWLTGWNSNIGGNKRVETFEVWKGLSDNNNITYKLVATSGDDVHGVGAQTYFQHDQTMQRMGRTWSMVGGFKAEEGGEAFGEIPNVKMPIYCYK